jgi:hypothetical protein
MPAPLDDGAHSVGVTFEYSFNPTVAEIRNEAADPEACRFVTARSSEKHVLDPTANNHVGACAGVGSFAHRLSTRCCLASVMVAVLIGRPNTRAIPPAPVCGTVNGPVTK